jgi:hypothetical protein
VSDWLSAFSLNAVDLDPDPVGHNINSNKLNQENYSLIFHLPAFMLGSQVTGNAFCVFSKSVPKFSSFF